LVERYNACLTSMGLTPTERRTINVDGAGWSPEIAQEQKNPFYLCVGEIINPTAIIIAPEQYKKPVYNPVFSWTRGLMRLVFEKYHREIIDITTTNVIILDFEDGLSSLKSPLDLLLLSEITAVPHTGHLAEAAVEQKEIIARFMTGLNCLDSTLCDELVHHKKQYGDLRRRKVAMQSTSYDLFNDFYTVAFNGVGLLRGVEDNDLLVFEDRKEFESAQAAAGKPVASLEYLYDPGYAAFLKLAAAGMIRIPIERFQTEPEVLDAKKDLLLALALCDCEPDIDWNSLTSAKRKTLMRKHEDLVPGIFTELERFTAILRRGGDLPQLSPELWHFLAEPSEKLPPGTQEVLWILLSHRETRNILGLYTHDKNRFLAEYNGWSAQKQEWVANYLAERYVPRMQQP